MRKSLYDVFLMFIIDIQVTFNTFSDIFSTLITDFQQVFCYNNPKSNLQNPSWTQFSKSHNVESNLQPHDTETQPGEPGWLKISIHFAQPRNCCICMLVGRIQGSSNKKMNE